MEKKKQKKSNHTRQISGNVFPLFLVIFTLLMIWHYDVVIHLLPFLYVYNSNYNYGPTGVALGEDLLNNPDMVATDAVVSFKTAIWFWMTEQLPKPSCHDVVIGSWTPSADDVAAGRLPGYGVTTNIINGGLECGIGPDSRVEDRIGFYKRYCDMFGIEYGDNLDCAN